MNANSGMNTIRELTDQELENVSGGGKIIDAVVQVVKEVVKEVVSTLNDPIGLEGGRGQVAGAAPYA